MRAGPLSDAATQKYIINHFVPVLLSRDRYLMPPASKEEIAFSRKLDETRRAKKLVGGAVAVYLADADGTTRDVLRVQDASKPGTLATWLEKHIQAHKLSQREVPPVVAAEQSRAARFVMRTRLHTKPDLGMGRDELTLSDRQLATLRPVRAEGKELGEHEVPTETAEALLRHAYPPLPWYQAKQVKIDRAQMRLTFRDATHARITGSLKLVYPALGLPTDGVVDATFEGEAEFDREGKLLRWVLVSDKASYTNSWMGKALTRTMEFSLEWLPAKE